MNKLISKEQMDYFWRKKEFVSFILSLLVFLIHISSFAPYPSDGDLIGLINEKCAFFFKESITRFAVPMYFILSGVSFFRDYDDTKYTAKLKSRFYTLCIPYLIWNTLWMIFDIICSNTFISKFFLGRKKFIFSLSNIARGIFLHGCNLPFWYVLYLMIFVVLAPVFYRIIRNKRIGIVIIGLLAVLSVLGIGKKLGFNYDAVVFYLIGALLGKHYFADVVKKTSTKKQSIAIGFLLVYVFAKNLHPENEYFGIQLVKIVVFVTASWSLWCIADRFVDKLPHLPIFSCSFAIFAMHTNVSAIIYKVIFLILPKSGYFAFINFILTMILTLAAINVFCVIFERIMPQTYALLMGKGLKNK